MDPILVFGLGFACFAAWMFTGLWQFRRRLFRHFQHEGRKKAVRIVILVLGPTLFVPWFWLMVWMYEG
jgi:hypothetical protein